MRSQLFGHSVFGGAVSTAFGQVVTRVGVLSISSAAVLAPTGQKRNIFVSSSSPLRRHGRENPLMKSSLAPSAPKQVQPLLTPQRPRSSCKTADADEIGIMMQKRPETAAARRRCDRPNTDEAVACPLQAHFGSEPRTSCDAHVIELSLRHRVLKDMHSIESFLARLGTTYGRRLRDQANVEIFGGHMKPVTTNEFVVLGSVCACYQAAYTNLACCAVLLLGYLRMVWKMNSTEPRATCPRGQGPITMQPLPPSPRPPHLCPTLSRPWSVGGGMGAPAKMARRRSEACLGGRPQPDV